MRPKTRHKHAHTGLVTPQLPQLLLTAALRLIAMLVLNVAATLQMIRRRGPVIGTQAMRSALPRETHDTFKEQQAAPQSSSPIALMLRSAAKLRVSKHEGVLTTMSHTSPSPSVSHAPRAIHLPLLRMGRQEFGGELPPSVRSTGGGGLPRLRAETEGALSIHFAPPSLRVRRFASNPRRKSGPRASRAMCVTGLRKQPWIPACAGMSGTRLAIQAPV